MYIFNLLVILSIINRHYFDLSTAVSNFLVEIYPTCKTARFPCVLDLYALWLSCIITMDVQGLTFLFCFVYSPGMYHSIGFLCSFIKLEPFHLFYVNLKQKQNLILYKFCVIVYLNFIENISEN